MPGVKSISWNDANDAKMLKALLHFGNIVLPANVADQIAAYMGNGVPGKAIQSHVTLTKQKMKKDLGAAGIGNVSITATPTALSGPSSVQKRPASGTAAATPSKKKKKDVSPVEDTSEEEKTGGESSAGDDSGDEPEVAVNTEKPTPPGPGPLSAKVKAKARATRSRSSPHGKLPVDYSKLHDPFTTMEGATDSDGENVFGSNEGNSSEDSFSSDKKFERGKEL